jgi:hypothetical protein
MIEATEDVKFAIAMDRMDARELVRGLMRGDRAQWKLGYSAAAAIDAVRTVKGDEAVTPELIAYAEGFADGMAEPQDRTYPAKPTEGVK